MTATRRFWQASCIMGWCGQLIVEYLSFWVTGGVQLSKKKPWLGLVFSSRKSTRCARRRRNHPSLLGYLSVLNAFYATPVSLQHAARTGLKCHEHTNTITGRRRLRKGTAHKLVALHCGPFLDLLVGRNSVLWKNTNLASSEKPHFLSPAKECLFQSSAKARLFETKQSQTFKKTKPKKKERSRCPKCKNT